MRKVIRWQTKNQLEKLPTIISHDLVKMVWICNADARLHLIGVAFGVSARTSIKSAKIHALRLADVDATDSWVSELLSSNRAFAGIVN